MDIEQIKKTITDQTREMNESLGRKKMVEREVPKDMLTGFLAQPNILAILGIRRCGKSVLSLKLLEGRKYGYLNFDDERISGVEAKDLNMVLQAFYELYGTDLEYLILDEIQNIEGWELFANRLRRTKKVILTGSNAKLLSGELATHLTGRYIDFSLYPFSFREFLKLNGIEPDVYSTKSVAETRTALSEYMKTGGFPEAYAFGREMITRIYEDIIYKDIILRHKIRNRAAFSETARYLVSNFAREFTFNKLKNVASVKNVHTIKNWVGCLESSYLLFVVNRFSFKLREQMMAPKKVYCTDTGIINSIAFGASENVGRLMENMVAIDLYRRKSYFSSSYGEEVYYWKDHQQREVDFVLKAGETVNGLLQVTYASSSGGIDEREVKSLLLASEELNCKNLAIITWDYDGELSTAGKTTIKCLPLWKWLLSANKSAQTQLEPKP